MSTDSRVDTDQASSSWRDPEGVWGFVTYCRQGAVAWHARHHRKGLHVQCIHPKAPWRQRYDWLWAWSLANWWIGVLFCVGSVLFAAASAMSLLGVDPSFQSMISVGYALGSIPFTIAAGLALAQSAGATAAPLAPHRGSMPFPGFKPHDLGWWSCALQFVGTLLFNVSTFAGTDTDLSVSQTQLWCWVPNALGSVLFLVSGALGYAEVTHRWWRWMPGSLSWWVVGFNLLGCIGFMISALAGYIGTDGQALEPAIADATTLQGALCFLVGAFLMLPELAGSTSAKQA